MATGPYPTPYIPVPDLDLSRSLSEGMRTGLAQAGREDELARRREEMTEGRRQFDLNLALQRDQYEKMRAIAEAQKEYEKLQYQELMKARQEARDRENRENPLIDSSADAAAWAKRDATFSTLGQSYRAHEEAPGRIRSKTAAALRDDLIKLRDMQMRRTSFNTAMANYEKMRAAGEYDAAISMELQSLRNDMDQNVLDYTGAEAYSRVEPEGFLGGLRRAMVPIWGQGNVPSESPEERMELYKTMHRQQQAANRDYFKSIIPRLRNIAALMEGQRVETGGFSEGTYSILRDLPEDMENKFVLAGGERDRELMSVIRQIRQLAKAAGLKENIKAERELTQYSVDMLMEEMKTNNAIIKSKDSSDEEKADARAANEKIKSMLR